VEAGVGLLPAGGGLKEIAERCARAATGDDPFDHIKRYFETVAMAKASSSALEAKQFGLLRETDVVVFNANELLYVAKNVAASLAESGWRPPLPQATHVAGDVGTATIKAQLVNMLAGKFISEHDMEIATRIADTLCGGNIERGSTVDAQWLLDLERHHFMELAQMAKTQERIAHTMATGKPLRN
jgi:3-hydroxyacyl-CoA dehydrogenase